MALSFSSVQLKAPTQTSGGVLDEPQKLVWKFPRWEVQG